MGWMLYRYSKPYPKFISEDISSKLSGQMLN